MSLEEQVKNALERALQQAGESLLQQAKEMEPTIVGQAQGPGVEYLWTDTDGSLRISRYFSDAMQSGMEELHYALANGGIKGIVTVYPLRTAVEGTVSEVSEAFVLLPSAEKGEEP